MPPAIALRLTVPIEPMRRHRGRYTQFAPTLTGTLDVRHLIILQRIAQTLEPAFPHDGWRIDSGHDWYQCVDCTVHSCAGCTERTVNPLECG